MSSSKVLVAIVAISLVALTAVAHPEDNGRKPDSDAKVSALIRQFEGSNIDRREKALDALLKMEPMTPAAIAALSQAMKNPDDAVRQYAVQVLACSGADAIPALALAIDDNDRQVRLRAVQGLGDMAGGRECYQTRGAAADAAAAGAKTWPILIGAFKDAHEDVRIEATFQFYRDKPAAVPLLRNALKDSDPKVRMGAAKALRQMGPEAKDACGDDLVLALKDPERDVRDEALTSLIDIDPTRRELLPILIQRLEDPDLKVRDKAVEQLERMKGNAEAAVPALAHLLATQTARNIYPHLGVIFALQNIRTANAAPVLAQVLSGELVPAIRREVPPPNVVIPLGSIRVEGGVVRELPVLPKPGAVIGVVGGRPHVEEDPQADLRRNAASAIGRLGANGIAALPALERALAGDKDPKVRLAAGRAIGELGAGGAPGVPALTQALRDDKDTEVRIAAARSIGKLGPAGAQGLPALIRVLTDDKDPDVRIAAVKAIGELGPSAAPAIPALVEALGASGSENNSTMEPLFAPCLSGSVRDVACATLAKLGKPAVPALSAALQSPDAIVRDGAAEALGADSVSPLPNEVVNELTLAMKDKDSRVRHDAAMALDVAGDHEERAADAELDREGKADTAKERAQRYSEEEILGPAEAVINDQKYPMQLDDSLPLSPAHERAREAEFLVTIHRGTAEDKFHFAPQRLAIWKTTGDNKFQLVYAIKANLPDLDSWMDTQFEEPNAFKSKVLVTGQGKDRYETGLFVDVPWQQHGWSRGNQVFALDPDQFDEVKIQSPDEWYANKLRPGEGTPNPVQNDFSDGGLNFKFGIHGYGDQGWHFVGAGEITGTYKIVKEMRYDSRKKNWTAAWKMVVNTAKREPLQESRHHAPTQKMIPGNGAYLGQLGVRSSGGVAIMPASRWPAGVPRATSP